MMEENEDTDRNEDEDEVHRRRRSMNMVKIQNQNQNAAGGVDGEAWTCDGQTNTINFIQFVCQSPWLLDAARDEYLRVAGRKEVGDPPHFERRTVYNTILRNHRLLFVTQQQTTNWAGDVLNH